MLLGFLKLSRWFHLFHDAGNAVFNLEGQQVENGVIYGCNSAPVLLAARAHIVSSPDGIKFIKEENAHKVHNDAFEHVSGGLASWFGAAPILPFRGFGGGMYSLHTPG